MSDLRQRLLAAFQLEQKSHLAKLRTFLDTLEGPSAPSGVDYQEVLRSAHTLKGASRAVDLRVLETVVHHLESLLMALKEGQIPASTDVVVGLRRVLDGVEDYAGSSDVEHREAPVHLVEMLENLMDGEASQPLSTLAAAAPKKDAFADETSAPNKGTATVRVPISTLKELTTGLQELQVEVARQVNSGQGLREISERLVSLEHDWTRLRRKGLTPSLDQTALFDLKIHQCLGKARTLLSGHTRYHSALSRLGDELERQVRLARMIPAEDVLGDLGPIARELARSQGKEIDFRSKGLDISVDRQVLAQLYEPLVHMIRNAVDHALETPQERARRGKSPLGKLELELVITKGQLETTLSDDGRGIDLDKVRARAAFLGHACDGDDQALLNLLLLPEFTTVAKPGKLSGRGMGLSILKQVAEELRGEVLLSRRIPCGAVVGLRTPLSITVQSLLLVDCEDQVFAIPSFAVERLVRLTPENLTLLQGGSSYLSDGDSIPVAELAEVLGLPGRGVRMEDGLFWGALVRAGGKRFLLAVDGLISQREVMVSELNLPGYSNPKISGMFLLEDESICLVLNPPRLWDSPKSGWTVGTRTEARGSDGMNKRMPTVLVVDDSITTRTLERSILETHGYQVVVAVDGEDALRQLKTHRVDLVISDVQMPVMDGFELLVAIKAEPNFQHLPVVLLTSCEDRADRQRGLDLGAEAYLSKQSFDQEGLLETVRQIA